MSKKIPLYTVLILLILAVLITFQITYLSVGNQYSRKLNSMIADYSYFDKLSSIDELARNYYIGDIDEERLEEGIMDGYMLGLGDKYGMYLTAEEYNALVDDQNAELVGIGVHVIYNIEYEALDIIMVMPNSPALEAGVEPGDLIVSVGGVSVSELGYYGALDAMRGDQGTVASFTVVRGLTEQIDFDVTRRKVTEISVMYHMMQYENGLTSDIGVIKILEFDSKTPTQFKEAIESLLGSGATSFIFDVRYNPGGELNSIVSILDYLLPEGPIIRTVDREGNEDVEYSDENWFDYPCAVLVNGNTASAAELFSSALQDYTERGEFNAVLVGTKTYGKGTMQTVIRLEDGSALSLSYKMYNPPYSDNYENIGVTPDIVEEMSEKAASVNIYRLADADDNQLQRAAEAIKASK